MEGRRVGPRAHARHFRSPVPAYECPAPGRRSDFRRSHGSAHATSGLSGRPALRPPGRSPGGPALASGGSDRLVGRPPCFGRFWPDDRHCIECLGGSGTRQHCRLVSGHAADYVLSIDDAIKEILSG